LHYTLNPGVTGLLPPGATGAELKLGAGSEATKDGVKLGAVVGAGVSKL
jgi:hypothetical protein